MFHYQLELATGVNRFLIIDTISYFYPYAYSKDYDNLCILGEETPTMSYGPGLMKIMVCTGQAKIYVTEYTVHKGNLGALGRYM